MCAKLHDKQRWFLLFLLLSFNNSTLAQKRAGHLLWLGLPALEIGEFFRGPRIVGVP
jgi:hypothetical protein